MAGSTLEKFLVRPLEEGYGVFLSVAPLQASFSEEAPHTLNPKTPQSSGTSSNNSNSLKSKQQIVPKKKGKTNWHKLVNAGDADEDDVNYEPLQGPQAAELEQLFDALD